MMTARALLDRNPAPTEREIREAVSGQICRCTGYSSIVRSVQWAAAEEAGTRTRVASAEDAEDVEDAEGEEDAETSVAVE
ncbi:(2Fe-2S)-binding protein, partial [Streptomyces daliensis]|nr:(2Fe-2S)-binding protein [Streptomyces daliensis]